MSLFEKITISNMQIAVTYWHVKATDIPSTLFSL